MPGTPDNQNGNGIHYIKDKKDRENVQNVSHVKCHHRLKRIIDHSGKNQLRNILQKKRDSRQPHLQKRPKNSLLGWLRPFVLNYHVYNY